jgi:transcriptional regulator with XRE-family HTH domain
MEERLITGKELAGRMGVSLSTVKRWTRSKLLPAGGIVRAARPARAVRYDWALIRRRLEEREGVRRERI